MKPYNAPLQVRWFSETSDDKPKVNPVSEIPDSVLERVDRLLTKAEENQRIEDSQKEQEMNIDWYEKGELPPVGTECEYIIGEHKGYNSCTFVGLNSRGNIVIETIGGEYLTYHDYQIKLRPLSNETDKLIEQVAEVITDCFNQCNDIDDWCVTDGIAKAIVEAGYRKIKQMSEDEFMRASLSSFETKRFEVSQLKLICESLRKLYSAGCRMIDNGVYNDE